MRRSRGLCSAWRVSTLNYVAGPKRAFDFIFSLIAVFLILPLIAIAAVAIKLSSPGPVFFRQERVGRGGRSFSIFKLRTMTVNPDRETIQTFNSDPQVFSVGKILRRTKIDELPQIFNVLRGDMSLVGPRPCLRHTYAEMPEWAQKRAQVRPGITGLAQINGNIALSWEERWRYDVRYVETLSFFGDIKLILKTVAVVLLGEERFKDSE